ncbi:hypothetical protein COCNU_scaffold041069G000010 [Cocos nucifera]|nr:hypothetical protein [Cocos nucifera]
MHLPLPVPPLCDLPVADAHSSYRRRGRTEKGREGGHGSPPHSSHAQLASRTPTAALPVPAAFHRRCQGRIGCLQAVPAPLKLPDQRSRTLAPASAFDRSPSAYEHVRQKSLWSLRVRLRSFLTLPGAAEAGNGGSDTSPMQTHRINPPEAIRSEPPA